MATMTELRALASKHDIEGRSKMDHVELTAALERAGAEIPDPVLPEPKFVDVEWRQQWRLVKKAKGVVKEKVDGDWQTVRERVPESEAATVKETLEKVWPHGRVRLRPATG